MTKTDIVSLGELSVGEVPDELMYLRAIADGIHNALVSPGRPEKNHRVALWLIGFVEANLKDAKIAVGLP